MKALTLELDAPATVPFDAACDAHDAHNEIRRDFLRACKAVQENGATMNPVIFQEWLDRERQAGMRFEIAVQSLPPLED